MTVNFFKLLLLQCSICYTLQPNSKCLSIYPLIYEYQKFWKLLYNSMLYYNSVFEVFCQITNPCIILYSPYRAVNTSHLGYKN